MNIARRKKRPVLFLFSWIIASLILFYLIVFVSPTYQLLFTNYHLPVIYFFFLFFFIAVFSLTTLALNNIRWGALISFFLISYLLLDLLGLTHPFFAILLIIIFIILEIVFR